MQVFRDILDECGFVDLGFVGNKFTWCKNDSNGCTVWSDWIKQCVMMNGYLIFRPPKWCIWSVDPLTISLSLFILSTSLSGDKNHGVLNKFGW